MEDFRRVLLRPAIELGEERLRLVVEVTERTDALVIAEAPWEVVASAREARRATKDVLDETCMQLEHQSLDAAEPNVLLACFQHAGQFTPAARSRYDVVVTHDRELVIRAAEPLLRRLVPEHWPTGHCRGLGCMRASGDATGRPRVVGHAGPGPRGP